MTEPELIEYFNEHVLYELLMLRYSKKCLEEGDAQLRWNASFAAFNVSARNLYAFLNNKGKRTDVNVVDYQRYRSDAGKTSVSDVQGTLNKLNAQCFHMGKGRFKESEGEVDLKRINEMSSWVESNMERLIKSFSEDFRSKLELNKAALEAYEHVLKILSLAGPSASAFASLLTIGPTGFGEHQNTGVVITSRHSAALVQSIIEKAIEQTERVCVNCDRRYSGSVCPNCDRRADLP